MHLFPLGFLIHKAESNLLILYLFLIIPAVSMALLKAKPLIRLCMGLAMFLPQLYIKVEGGDYVPDFGIGLIIFNICAVAMILLGMQAQYYYDKDEEDTLAIDEASNTKYKIRHLLFTFLAVVFLFVQPFLEAGNSVVKFDEIMHKDGNGYMALFIILPVISTLLISVRSVFRLLCGGAMLALAIYTLKNDLSIGTTQSGAGSLWYIGCSVGIIINSFFAMTSHSDDDEEDQESDDGNLDGDSNGGTLTPDPDATDQDPSAALP